MNSRFWPLKLFICLCLWIRTSSSRIISKWQKEIILVFKSNVIYGLNIYLEKKRRNRNRNRPNRKNTGSNKCEAMCHILYFVCPHVPHDVWCSRVNYFNLLKWILAKPSKPSPGIKAQVLKDKEEREAIVLWRQPVNTLYNATLEIITLSISGIKAGIERLHHLG